MKTTLRILMLCLCCALPFWAHAQDTHWSVNIYDYQYDMTAYLSLSNDGEAVTALADFSDYEIAAFCGDECRGVATVQTYEKDGVTVPYAYLRIRSNQAEGEEITFKVYVKSNNIEVDVKDFSMAFVSQSVQGMPSSPVVLDFVPFMPGDPDGDGEVTINDVIMAINASLGNPSATIIAPAADMDGDGSITINDVIMIINKTLNK